MTAGDAQAFAEDWIAAWNSHDLARILAHYDPAIRFLSPNAVRLTGAGEVCGVAALGDYWGRALAGQPELHFTLDAVLTGHECLTILYHNHRGQQVAETVEFGAAGTVVRSMACYGPGPADTRPGPSTSPRHHEGRS